MQLEHQHNVTSRHFVITLPTYFATDHRFPPLRNGSLHCNMVAFTTPCLPPLQHACVLCNLLASTAPCFPLLHHAYLLCTMLTSTTPYLPPLHYAYLHYTMLPSSASCLPLLHYAYLHAPLLNCCMVDSTTSWFPALDHAGQQQQQQQQQQQLSSVVPDLVTTQIFHIDLFKFLDVKFGGKTLEFSCRPLLSIRFLSFLSPVSISSGLRDKLRGRRKTVKMSPQHLSPEMVSKY